MYVPFFLPFPFASAHDDLLTLFTDGPSNDSRARIWRTEVHGVGAAKGRGVEKEIPRPQH